MSSFLLGLSVATLTYFATYWASLLLFAWLRGGRTPGLAGEGPGPARDRSDNDPRVRVLIPSHHEGEAVVDTVRTLLDQTYAGYLEVEILVADRGDESVDALCRAFGVRRETTESIELCTNAPRAEGAVRRARVTIVGHQSKRAKLNHALGRDPQVEFVAFLDADHRAHPDWIRRALETLQETRAAGVQNRKCPLAVETLAQCWDAGLSHVAFEWFNQATMQSFGTVAFTGSTAVFRVSSLAGREFADCITEDTYLSYDLLLDGEDIAYDPRVGSYEEATPNIPSFVFRRRRWAAGHTHALLDHLGSLGRSSAPLSVRTLVFVLGQFFLVPTAAWFFFAAQGLYYFMLFSAPVRWVVLGIGGLLAAALTLWLSRRRSTKAPDFVVLLLTVLPFVSLSGGLVQQGIAAETYYFISSFPYQGTLWGIQAGLLLAAAASFLLAWSTVRSFGPLAAFTFVATLPLLVFFELLSALLGFSDLLTGRREWSRIDRSHAVSEQVGAELGSLRPTRTGHGRARWIALVLMGAVALVAANEHLSVDPCGQPAPFLWPPLFRRAEADGALRVRTRADVVGGRMQLAVRTVLRRVFDGDAEVQVFDGDRRVGRFRMAPGSPELDEEVVLEWPIDWSRGRIVVTVSGVGLACRHERAVARRVVALENRQLRLNGEPFVIKGIVPTFSAPSVGLSLDEGYRQLKSVGVNTARLYHPPTDAILQAARRHDLLLLPQPDGSTWDSVNPTQTLDRHLYARRWDSLRRRTEGNPYVLMLNAGNELEIEDRSQAHVDAIRELLQEVTQSHEELTTYSTFATYLDYPVDVLGINMLDTGDTYWRRAIPQVARGARPFFASELGGFVAFFEAPPSSLRQWRMREQAATLDRIGALGGVYFASHDNWSQAVPPGNFNDPFRGEHPDDHRGYFTTDNEPKPELEMLAFLLADASVEVVEPRVTRDASEVRLRVRNRRPYALEDLTVDVGDGAILAVARLDAGQTIERSVSLEELRRGTGYPFLRAQLSFTTHRGLRGAARWRLTVPDPQRGPVVVGPLFQVHADAARVSGLVLIEGEARILVPQEWAAAEVNGTPVEITDGVATIPLASPVQAVQDLQVSRDGRRWAAWHDPPHGSGDIFLRCELPPRRADERLLVLSGVASTRLHFRDEGGAMFSVPAHPYRENTIDLARREGSLSVRFRRTRPYYVAPGAAAAADGIPIVLERPFVFSPVRLEVRRAD